MKLQTVFFITVIRRRMNTDIKGYENLPIEIDKENRNILHKSTGDVYIFIDKVSDNHIDILINRLNTICKHNNHGVIEHEIYDVTTIVIGKLTNCLCMSTCEFTIINNTIMKISFVYDDLGLNTTKRHIRHVTLIATNQNDIFK